MSLRVRTKGSVCAQTWWTSDACASQRAIDRVTMMLLMDVLDVFRDHEEVKSDDVDAFSVTLDSLVFNYGTSLYAVPSNAVLSIIAWSEPAPLPETSPVFSGVVQDRGRIVAVLHRPGAGKVDAEAHPQRIVVCDSGRGLVGLPASDTRAVTEVGFPVPPQHAEITDSSHGPLVFLDPHYIAASMHDETEPALEQTTS